MSFIEINGAQIYYEAFGEDKPGWPPLILIHGSPNTGRVDWGLVAPLLAQHYRVIVPDCRGHGQSTNPAGTYSFRQMASDIAGMVRVLGYGRAHLIGHSNGGNVALVVLLEHPEVVQSAVLQAANAYVSPDLVERETVVFDPARVERQAPDWMAEMIALHGPTHGNGYWRDLLMMTLQEIITQPNYTRQDLAQVRRPVLVVQGENDQVNAPARHAQFIAEGIPEADVWLPAGVGHNVHKELLFAWVERIMDFLARRGDDANDALCRLQRQQYPDERLDVFQLQAESQTPGADAVRLTGQVLCPEMLQSAQDHLASLGYAVVETGEVKVLMAGAPWALVKLGVADLRQQPRSQVERLSQVLYGEAVRVLERQEEWCWVRLEHDGYLGWVPSAALFECTLDEVRQFRGSLTHMVRAESTCLYPPDYSLMTAEDPQQAIGRLPFGAGVQVVEKMVGWLRLLGPDGHLACACSEALLPLEQRPRPDEHGLQDTLNLIRGFVGIPYLWGGRTPFGFDCSGLAQAFYGFMGVDIPRDADQQCKASQPVESNWQPGDLLFFGRESADRLARRYDQISHVAISLGGEEIIHANGAAGGVSLNSLDPASPRYRAWLRENLVAAGRFR